MKKIYKIKWENILLLLFIPLALIQFYKANIDYKVISILMSLLIYGGTFLTIKEMRKETLQLIKQGLYEPLIDCEEIKDNILTIASYLIAIKKEVIKQVRYINDQAYILKTSFK